MLDGKPRLERLRGEQNAAQGLLAESRKVATQRQHDADHTLRAARRRQADAGGVLEGREELDIGPAGFQRPQPIGREGQPRRVGGRDLHARRPLDFAPSPVVVADVQRALGAGQQRAGGRNLGLYPLRNQGELGAIELHEQIVDLGVDPGSGLLIWLVGAQRGEPADSRDGIPRCPRAQAIHQLQLRVREPAQLDAIERPHRRVRVAPLELDRSDSHPRRIDPIAVGKISNHVVVVVQRAVLVAASQRDLGEVNARVAGKRAPRPFLDEGDQVRGGRGRVVGERRERGRVVTPLRLADLLVRAQAEAAARQPAERKHENGKRSLQKSTRRYPAICPETPVTPARRDRPILRPTPRATRAGAH